MSATVPTLLTLTLWMSLIVARKLAREEHTLSLVPCWLQCLQWVYLQRVQQLLSFILRGRNTVMESGSLVLSIDSRTGSDGVLGRDLEQKAKKVDIFC